MSYLMKSKTQSQNVCGRESVAQVLHSCPQVDAAVGVFSHEGAHQGGFGGFTIF